MYAHLAAMASRVETLKDVKRDGCLALVAASNSDSNTDGQYRRGLAHLPDVPDRHAIDGEACTGQVSPQLPHQAALSYRAEELIEQVHRRSVH